MNNVLVALGGVFLALGVLGIFLPVLPTTPFLLLTAALWVRSSPRLYQWLLSRKYLGAYIRNFRENRAIPLHAKIVSLVLMWTSMLFCAFGPLAQWRWAGVLLIVVAILVTRHILSFKTLKKK